MRLGLSTLLFIATAAGLTLAQPPAPPTGAGKLVIRPGGAGATNLDPRQGEKAGFIIIRPNGKGASTTPADAPRQPVLVAGRSGSASLNVPPPGPVRLEGPGLFDYWFAVAVENQRIGHVHWNAKEMQQKEKSFVTGARYLKLKLARFGQVVEQWSEESTVESPAGDVYLTSMRQGIGKDQALALSGTVDLEKKILKVKGEGAAAGAGDTPWPAGVVGVAREPRLFREARLKEGESLDYPSYIPTVNRVVKTTITYEGEETKALWKTAPARKLLRFHTKPEPIGKVKLPASTTWVDAETCEPLQMETDFPALGGRLTFLRTTEEAATAPVTRPVEVFNAQSIQLNRRIPGIHARDSIVYRVSVPRDDEPETVFANERRQRLENLDAKTRSFELHVSAQRGPEKGSKDEPAPAQEFLESNFFINWDNDLVKGHAARATAALPARASAWEKAVAIERWVKANMKAFEFTQAMATADNVARNLSGDCTEYAMLAAAMCRSVGVPSRTALGLVYAESGGKQYLAYHMWFEVYAEGQWCPLDATLGMGGVGPGHVKITDHSWHDERSFAPLLPVLRVLSARPVVEVLKVGP
jgi:transglutaminase-like putative cysteine protease